jgi:predicted O-linked N-acetylglucosamine transferase (SPINDLY family)
MTDNVLFTSALKQLAERNLTVTELLQTSDALKPSGIELSLELYRRWIERNPSSPLLHAVHFNYSVLLRERGELGAAKEALERSLALKPDFFAARINLGGIYEKIGAIDHAIAQWLTIANQLPLINGSGIEHKIMALTQIGRVLQGMDKAPEAEAVLRQILEIDPTQRTVIEQFMIFRVQQIKWPLVAGAGVPREALLRKFGPLSTMIYTDDPLLQLATAASYNKEGVGYPPTVAEVKPRGRNPGRLRIGYLSSDLRSHAIGSLMAEVFELHDRSKVEVFAYYCGVPASDDPMQVRIKAAVEHWIDVSTMDNASLAGRIAADGIDILVDINGYTKDARPVMLAMRPAPIIVNWLGYPGTMGSPYHHYIIADDWIIPKEHEIYFSETVKRLPCYQPNDRKRAILERPVTRAEVKLPEDAMVYCCFNGAQKISRFTFDRWMTILSRVPDSVLWLLQGNGIAMKRLVELAAERGIAAHRIIWAPTLIRAHHLARYALADLFLDTVPYGAHTTASDALWTGVPILTLSGHSFASRVCGSLARAAGVPDLVCSTPEEYVERAVAFGQDRTPLKRYREQLRANRDTCPLFDSDLLVRRLEGLYREMWDELHDGRRPRPDLANLDVYQEVGIETDHETVEVLAIKDYRAWFKEKLARRHRRCAIEEDRRLWTAADIAAAEAADIPASGTPKPKRQPAKKRAR